APELFRGYRGRLLTQVLESRFRAEQAAADERVPSWVLATLEQGDEARREVQDRLFVGGRPAPEITRKLDDADRLYERALADVRAKLLERARLTAPSLADEPTGSPSASDPLLPTDPDPEFWTRALAEARQAYGLLKLGGFGPADLGSVQAALEGAERAIQRK